MTKAPLPGVPEAGRACQAQGGSKIWPVLSKPEFRRRKAEGNPKTEGRVQSHYSGAQAHRIKPYSDLGFRPSFGLRISVFGFQGCGICFPANRPSSPAVKGGCRINLWPSFGRTGKLLRENPGAPGERPEAKP